MKNEKSIWLYLCFVFIVSYTWQFFIYKTGGVDSILFPFLMWFPGLITVAYIIITKMGFKKIGWEIQKWKYLFPAIFVPLAVSIGLVFFLELLNLGSLSNELFVFSDDMLESTKIGLLFGNTNQSIAFFIMNFILSHLVFLTVGCLLTIGEELAWRGYLQEKLLRKYNLTLGLIVLGAIWGYWHLPIILMGYNFQSQPVLGALLLMPIGTIFLGIFLGWIYLRSQSIWMPALAHASLNLFSGFLYGMTMHSDELIRQLMWIGGWCVVAIFCLINLHKKRPTFWQETTPEMDGQRVR